MGRVLITGRPGSGKTTLVARAAEILTLRGETLGGFVTREIRRGGRRTGFTVAGLHGQERTLAVEGGPGPRVGRYGVDVAAFEGVAIVELESALELGSVIVIDEIGTMELLSSRFRDLLARAMDAPRVLATVHARRHPTSDWVKQRVDVRIVDLSETGRDPDLAARVAAWVLDG